MRRGRPKLIFDTSSLNALADDQESQSLVQVLDIGFVVRLSETSLSEIGATRKVDRRTKLLDLCRRLVHGGECVRPYNWIIEELVRSHAASPAQFDWRGISVRGRELEEDLTRQEFLGTEELAKETLAEFEMRDEEFEAIYKNARPAFERIFEGGRTDRPSLSELIDALKTATPPAFWRLGIGMYKRASGKELDEERIKAFIASCPPFNAALISLCVALFERCIRNTRAKSDYNAGRLDLFMAVYLPYSDYFVSRDSGQCKALRFVGSQTGIQAQVLTYEEFRQRLLMSPIGRA